jgi:hypothetical protein
MPLGRRAIRGLIARAPFLTADELVAAMAAHVVEAANYSIVSRTTNKDVLNSGTSKTK